MEFTTHFELQSQTTRLVNAYSKHQTNGSLTLYAVLFQGTSSGAIYRIHTTIRRFILSKKRRFTIGALPASVALTEGILVSFFSSA